MKPFDEGYRAFKRGNVVNPYHKNTVRNRDWEFGFNKAYFDNLKELEIGQTEKAAS